MNNTKKYSLALAATIVLLVATPADAQFHDRWEHLGSRSVMLARDRDAIVVGMIEGHFRELQIVVRNNGVFFNEMTVIYSNGGNDSIPLRTLIPAGGRSRLIDLRGGDRFIRRIEFSYRSVPNGRGRALVEVYGRR
jgi:hypothetical protein